MDQHFSFQNQNTLLCKGFSLMLSDAFTIMSGCFCQVAAPASNPERQAFFFIVLTIDKGSALNKNSITALFRC